jgi:dihydrofolate synthase/folylpolyglutamate synthase
LTYRSALGFLDSLVNYERQARPRDRFKLDAIRRLLERCGNPQLRLPRTILVAGTKGKGSVSHMLEAGLRGCGLSTGLFVSPHVLDVRERIQLNGRPISESLFARQVGRLAPLVRRQPVSYFELTTAMACNVFARRRPDYCVIEVGLGGRLDATNLADPQVSVITRIGFDHLNVLGRTLPKIAREKAGIMRPDRPVVISKQQPAARKALSDAARRTGSHLIRSDRAVAISRVTLTLSGSSFHAAPRSSFGIRKSSFSIPLLGRHQVENCRTALATLSVLARTDPRIRLSGARSGLGRVSIPARCQVVSRSPLTIVDSCHNPESGAALAQALRDHILTAPRAEGHSSLVIRHPGRIVLVYGSLRGKLTLRTVRPLAPLVHHAVLVQPDSPRALPLPLLKSVFTRLHIPHSTAPDVRSALSSARDRSMATGNRQLPVVVAGSFYLAGDALRLFGRGRRD